MVNEALFTVAPSVRVNSLSASITPNQKAENDLEQLIQLLALYERDPSEDLLGKVIDQANWLQIDLSSVTAPDSTLSAWINATIVLATMDPGANPTHDEIVLLLQGLEDLPKLPNA